MGIVLLAKYKEIRKTLIVVLVLNAIVALAKGIYGLRTNSLSLIADAFHSVFDASSNIIGLIGIKLASKPPDVEHPYGHWKYETIAAIFITSMLFLTVFELVESAVERFISPEAPEITIFSFLIVIITLFINLGTTIYENRKGKSLNSSILVADSLHTRSDVFVSISVLVSFVGVLWGYPILDPIIAIFVAVMIFHTGVEIAKESAEVLVDTSIVEPSEIQTIIGEIEGVVGVHQIRSRGKSDEILVDLHVIVDPSISVKKGHDIASEVKYKLIEKIPGVRDVTVHIEPAGHPEEC